MKALKVAALAGAVILAMTAAASAEPISIGSFIISGLLSIGGGAILPAVSAAAIGNFVLAAAAVGASLLASSLAAGQETPVTDPGDYKNTFDDVETSEVNAIGRVRLGGLKAFGNTSGYERFRLIWHSRGPLVAVEEYRLGGREVIVESDGRVSSPPYLVGTTSHVSILTKAGIGTETAWSELSTPFPGLWTSNHRCRGIFQSLVKYVSPGFSTEDFIKMYQGGEPDLEVNARVGTCYDPRDGGQNVNNPATWKWSDNGILCAARKMVFWPGVGTSGIDWDFIAAEADKADVLVDTLTGTERRSRCCGVWLSETPRGDVMQQLLDSIGAEIVMSDAGLVRIRLIDDAPTSEETIAASEQTEFNWKSGPEAVERPNVCVLKYYSPELNYVMGEVDLTGIPWARIDDEVTRYGEKQTTVELPFCPSASQAQRIARRLFAMQRADTGTVKTNMVGMVAWGKTYVSIEDGDAEETMLCKIGSPRVDDDAGEVEIPFAVWPTLTEWSPAVDEAFAPEIVPEIGYEATLDTPGAPNEVAVVQYPDLTWETRARVTPVSGYDTYEVVYRTYTLGEPNQYAGMVEYEATVSYAYAAYDSHGQKVSFKFRCYDVDGGGSEFSDVLTVDPLNVDNTTPSAPSVTATATNPSPGTYHIGGNGKATTQLRVARLRIRYQVNGGAFTTLYDGAVRPEDAKSFAFDVAQTGTPKTVNVEAHAFTTNGTSSVAGTWSTVVPATP